MSRAAASMVRSPLCLLVTVNALQAWRRVCTLRQQSRLLTTLIAGFLASYAGLTFLLFYKGLRFASSFPGLGAVLIERMLFLLFAFLFSLLLLSNLVICYTNLFRNRETSFLLPLPIPAEAVFQWKFIESALLASWAFLFLIAPMLAAYGLTQAVPWHFYVATTVFLGLFIVLPASVGAFAALNLARWLDRRLFQLLAIASALGILAAITFWLKADPVTDEQLESRVLVVLDRLLMRTRFALFPLLPSYWLSAGVQQWAEGAVSGALFFGLVLLSHVLFFGGLMFTHMGGLFCHGVSVVQSRGSVLSRWRWFRSLETRRSRTARQPSWLENVVGFLVPARPSVRAILVKDLRVFWRDTTQWAQTVVLFGLLAAYILNLRHFSQQLSNPFWVHLVSYLNLGACALNLATLTTRFVYPQFSLEGKRLWVIGMAPLGLRRVLLTKLGMASVLSLAVTLGLMLLSCRMLKLEPARTTYLAIAITLMTLALNGLAVGLGALYPNLKEDNPSKVVSGFGGTFCLVVSFFYIVASVVILGMGSAETRWAAAEPWLVPGSRLAFLALTVLVGWLPVRLALRQVHEFEL